jgi:endonuclease/exonuclease/phosphatase family metal-dependent hydrolase
VKAIKIASYNVHKAIGSDRQRNPERILAVLAELDADVVALQEADLRFGSRLAALPPEMIATHSPYRPVPFDIRPGSLGWHGNAILVRHGLELGHHRHLHLPCVEPRGAVMAEIGLPGGMLRVVSMHLDLSGLRRRHQARAIMAQIGALPPLPGVMMGDMNEWRQRGGCLDEFDKGFVRAETGPSFPARQPLLRLDRIFVGAGVRLIEAGVHDTPLAKAASDHLPIWTTMAT